MEDPDSIANAIKRNAELQALANKKDFGDRDLTAIFGGVEGPRDPGPPGGRPEGDDVEQLIEQPEPLPDPEELTEGVDEAAPVLPTLMVPLNEPLLNTTSYNYAVQSYDTDGNPVFVETVKGTPMSQAMIDEAKIAYDAKLKKLQEAQE